MRFPHGGRAFGLGSRAAIANRRTDRSAAMTSSPALASGCHGYGHRFLRDVVSALMQPLNVYLCRILEVAGGYNCRNTAYGALTQGVEYELLVR